MYQITIEKVFAASLALRLPDGSYEPTHGHNWPVRVTIGADQLDAMDCVMDFHELERIVDGVLAYFHHRITNGVAEGLNSKIMSIKRKARGHRNKENFKTAIYFFCGGLGLHPQ